MQAEQHETLLEISHPLKRSEFMAWMFGVLDPPVGWAAPSGMHQPQGSQKAGFVPSHWYGTYISVKKHFGIWEAMGFYWIHESCAFNMQVYFVFVEIKEVLRDA